MVSLKAPRFDNVLFLQGLSERVRHFKLKCVAGLCSKLVFRNSGHIQQFFVEAISLRAGRVSLCGLDSLHFHLSTYLFAYQGIPDPASCRAGLRRGGSVPEPTYLSLHATASGFKGRRLRATPGSQQGSWFPASLTGKTFEDQDLGWHIATTALPCPCCPDRSCSTTERRSTRLVPRPVADGRRR